MDGLFAQMYAADIKGDRPSIALETLRCVMPIQVHYGVAQRANSRSRPNTSCYFAGSLACPWTMDINAVF